MSGCFICDKHSRADFAPLVVGADDLVVVSLERQPDAETQQ